MAEFNLMEESLDKRQTEGPHCRPRMLDELADIAEEGLPAANWTVYGDDPQNITETETQFGETWTEVKECVETHLERTALDESPARVRSPSSLSADIHQQTKQ